METEFSIKSIFEQAQSGKLKMHSALGTRDESKQAIKFVPRIQKMATVCGIKARALLMKDIVLPFNPFTLESDETYNEKQPYRPILLVSQVIEGIKDLCIKNSELKKGYEELLEGTFSDCTEATLNDYLLFKHKGYIFPRVTSYYVTEINMNGKQGLPGFKVKYTVDERELNTEKNYDYDKAPIHAQLAALFNSICRAEWEAAKTILDKNAVTDEEKTAKRREIFSKSPISYIRPYNVVPFFFFPLNEDFPVIKKENFMNIEKCIRFYNKTDKWINAFAETQKSDDLDDLIDFYDFTITTPASGTPSSSSNKVLTDDDPNAIYQALTITVTDGRKSLATAEHSERFASVYSAIKSYFINSQMEETKEDGMHFEKIIALSTRCRPVESITEALLPAACEIFNEKFADSKFFTENVKKSHAKILCAMNPENAMLTAQYDDDELDIAGKEGYTDMAEFMDVIAKEEEVKDATENISFDPISDDEEITKFEHKEIDPDTAEQENTRQPLVIG